MSRITSFFQKSPPKVQPTARTNTTTITPSSIEFSDKDIELDEETLRRIEENRKQAIEKRKIREALQQSTGIESNLKEVTWINRLYPEFSKPYFKELNKFLQQEKESKQIVYPPDHLVFNALNSCPFESVFIYINNENNYNRLII